MRKPDSVNPELVAALGRRIRAHRKVTGLTATAFAEANGWDRNLWGRIERGRQNVSISTLGKIAAGLRVPMSVLLDGIEHDRPEAAGKVGKAG